MPLLKFDPEVGITAPTSAELRGVVANNWQNAFDRNDGSPVLDTEDTTPAGQLVDSETMILAQLNAELLYLFSQLNPRIAEGIWQDAIGYIYFLTRKIAQPTTVDVTCIGLPDTIIPVGVQVKDVNEVRYECVAAVTIPASGRIKARFQCLEAGPIECPKGCIDTMGELNVEHKAFGRIVTVVPGWDNAVNEESGVTGYNKESQVDFENRRYESVAKNSHGAVASIQGALWNLDGVQDCRVLENTGDTTINSHGIDIPSHSIAVCIYASDDIDTEIARTIYERKDAGCGTLEPESDDIPEEDKIIWPVTYQVDEPLYLNAQYIYYIVKPKPRSVKVSVTINKTPLTPDGIDAKIKKAVVQDFLGQDPNSGNPRVGLASTIYASRFSVAIVKTAGAQDLVNIDIKLAGDSDWGKSIIIDGKTEPVMTANDVTVNIIPLQGQSGD